MGYKRKLYKLRWKEDHQLHGLEVDTTGASIDRIIGLATLAAKLAGTDDIEAQGKLATKLFRQFSGHLVRWNLEDDDDTPVPAKWAICRESGQPLNGDICAAHADREDGCEFTGARAQDFDFMLSLVNSWVDAVSSVDIPLPQGSSNGSSSAPEASLPMEPISVSPPS